MIDQLIVVDYVQGAGGEFFANFLSAHFGSKLEFDSQRTPNFLQKWVNTQSLLVKNWEHEFRHHLLEFQDLCNKSQISRLAIPYHLYKWPNHIDIIAEMFPTRFIRINTTGYEHIVRTDFERKVWFRKMTKKDVGEVKFLLQRLDSNKQQKVIELYLKQELVFKDLIDDSMDNVLEIIKTPPSRDIEIFYRDFFLDFDAVPAAYKKLCVELKMIPDTALLNELISRNKKNWQDLQSYLLTCDT